MLRITAHLCLRSTAQLSNVSIFIFQMKMFEAVRPLQTEIDQMRLRNKTLEDQTKSFSKEVLELQEV